MKLIHGPILWDPAGAEGCNEMAIIRHDMEQDDTLDVMTPDSCNPNTFRLLIRSA